MLRKDWYSLTSARLLRFDIYNDISLTLYQSNKVFLLATIVSVDFQACCDRTKLVRSVDLTGCIFCTLLVGWVVIVALCVETKNKVKLDWLWHRSHTTSRSLFSVEKIVNLKFHEVWKKIHLTCCFESWAHAPLGIQNTVRTKKLLNSHHMVLQQDHIWDEELFVSQWPGSR